MSCRQRSYQKERFSPHDDRLNFLANGSDFVIYYVSEKRPELLDAVCDKLYLAVTKIQNVHIKEIIIGNAGAFHTLPGL